MAAPYTSVPVTNYNANPPADDGSAVAANQIKWATAKTKLGDPLNTAVIAINAGISTAFGKMLGGASSTSTGVSLAVTSAHQGQWVRATASSITLTFPDATSVGSPFVFGLLNSSAGNVTLAGASAQTINGSTSITMAAGDGYIAFTDGSNWFVVGRKTGVLPPGALYGCVLANGADATNDITITAGKVRDSTDTVDITVAAMATGKQLDANWAPGDAAGMRNSAAGIANTTYHIYVVAKADGTQDIYAHTSTTVATVITALQAESGGSAYVYARRIGSIVRISAAILAFTQRGNHFAILTPALELNAAAGDTSAHSLTLTTVPAGISVQAHISLQQPGSSSAVYISDLTQTDSSPAFTAAPLATIGLSGGVPAIGMTLVWTNTSGAIRYRSNDGTTVIRIATLGYYDLRGRDA